ncbi:hypothetical protein [Staphylococcus arlettae]|uniref:hypothetical protein n=1 Tax=Staphylococcus arlettae TaxID=29378 RepID=UPI002DBB51EA|nr:hypothetical protein [Staphylococcus arlettae]MEB5899566.1 hypothetical protein [Staphylococcus arlettae]
MNFKPLLYAFFIIIWMIILQKIVYGPFIITIVYFLLTISILLFINIKNKNLQNFLLNIYQDRKYANLLKYWVILDDKKEHHKKLVRNYHEKVNTVMYVFSLIFLFIITFLLNVTTIIQPLINILLIIILIALLFCLLQTVLYKFPSAITLIVPFISFFIVLFLHETKAIENLIWLKALFILFSVISYAFICFGAQPYVIRILHKNQLFINGIPNIFLLIITLSMNSIKKPSLNFKEDPNFSKLPDDIQVIFSNQEFVNTIRDLFYQYQITEITSEITTYILMITITIFTFSALLNIKMRYDDNKAKKELSNVRKKSIEHPNFCYSDFQKISYYGGSYYEDQLFAIPGVYKFIYDIEVNKDKI